MQYPVYEARNEVVSILKKALSKLKYETDIKLEKPPEEKMGDFAFPCFSIAKTAKKSPNLIADEVIRTIEKTSWVEKIEKNGAYINFFINQKKTASETLELIIKNKEKYGFLDQKNKKVIVEHTSANPNGPLHVGRARNPIIGDTIARIYKTAGYNVETQFYLDDMGKQVAILAWGLNNLDPKQIPQSDYEKTDHQKVGFYQKANEIMEKDEKIAEEINEIIRKSEKGDTETLKLIHTAYKPVLEGIKQSMKRINITIDRFIPESTFVKDKTVDTVVEKLKKSDYCGVEDGAYYIDMEPFGVQGRNTKFFFLRKDGTTLYATRDIAYHLWKNKQADVLINILGEDHKLESKQVEVALKIIGAKKLPTVIFYSFVSLPEGKMSTRRGRVVYLDELIDECIKRAYVEVKKRRGKELSEEKMRQIAEKIGIGALRYNIIKVQPEKGITFKWEEALNFDGNSSPFIQYAHARACSILSKNKEKISRPDASVLNHTSELNLVKKLAELPLVVEEAYTGFKPHIIASYLFSVASLFNQFYRDCPVIHEKNQELRKARLSLVDATRIILKNGLNLLGIVAPEEM
ncbi:MAG: arginine--tRNA ligase [Thermoplasmata archaeon]|nr:MAG: arginine--tRNA ligase [Thermoplasmata archaeon]RLF62693.1 MAG: arginine--tRNA ligase [Thermoplasmata archaeon]